METILLIQRFQFRSRFFYQLGGKNMTIEFRRL